MNDLPNANKTDAESGIYHKYQVTRTDGSSLPGHKHDNCFYFVLDTDHDPHARAALLAYAESCRAAFPLLARDIYRVIGERPFGSQASGEVKP